MKEISKRKWRSIEEKAIMKGKMWQCRHRSNGGENGAEIASRPSARSTASSAEKQQQHQRRGISYHQRISPLAKMETWRNGIGVAMLEEMKAP
jgi:hypothetical protein